MAIIGVMGQLGSGKDTFADFLVKQHGYTKISLADPLKRICKEVFDFTDTQLWGPSDARNQPDLRYAIPGKGFLSARVALQTLGTEWGRNCYENVWVDYALRAAQAIEAKTHYYSQKEGLLPNRRLLSRLMFWKKNGGVVIPDVRFKNELDAIHKIGGVVVRLRRVKADLMAGTQGVKNHASEMEQRLIPDYDLDYVLNVPEGIGNFHEEIAKMLPKLTFSKVIQLKRSANG